MYRALGLVLLAGCDAVFGSSPPPDASLVDGRTAGDDAIHDAANKCMDARLRLCLTFDDGNLAVAADGSTFDNSASMQGVTAASRNGDPAITVSDDSDVAITNPTTLDLPGPMTFAMWLRFSSAQRQQLSAAFDNNIQYAMVVDEATKAVECVAVIPSQELRYARAVLAPDRWYHITCVKTANDFAIWVDGEHVTTTSVPEMLNVGEPSDVRIGQDAEPEGPINPLRGDIDEVRVFDGALGDTEIAALAGR